MQTPRLLLRALQHIDIDDIACLYSDPEVVRFIGDGLPCDRETSEAWLNKALVHWSEHGFGTWSILLRQTGEFIGRAGLTIQELEYGSETEVGYMLAAKHWHQGYATEAATALRDHAIQNLGLHRLVALIDHDNEASKRVAIRLGMTFEREVQFGSRWRELGRMVDLFAAEHGVGTHSGRRTSSGRSKTVQWPPCRSVEAIARSLSS